MNAEVPNRLVIGISGASGAIYGIRLLEILHGYADVETHLVISAAAKRTIVEETDLTIDQVEALATTVYPNRDIGASIASGSFKTIGMVIAPCSIKTLSAVAYTYSDSLLARAADVTLKESRPLIALVRETPWHPGHLRAMAALAEAGGVILPPMPAFYHRPQSIDDLVNHTCGRVLSRLGLAQNLVREWQGRKAAPLRAWEILP
ncbi:MAG: UbiX family flavin prenyltransferase [Candidatus Methylomirabilia bacterium]